MHWWVEGGEGLAPCALVGGGGGGAGTMCTGGWRGERGCHHQRRWVEEGEGGVRQGHFLGRAWHTDPHCLTACPAWYPPDELRELFSLDPETISNTFTHMCGGKLPEEGLGVHKPQVCGGGGLRCGLACRT